MTEDFYAVAFVFEFSADYWKAIMENNEKQRMQVLKDKEEKDEKKVKDAQEYVKKCKADLERAKTSLEFVSAENKDGVEQRV